MQIHINVTDAPKCKGRQNERLMVHFAFACMLNYQNKCAFFLAYRERKTSRPTCSTATVSDECVTEPNPNPPQSNKIQQGEVKKNALSPITTQKRVSYGHEIAARAVTLEWRARDGQWIVVRETPGSYPGGSPIPPHVMGSSAMGINLGVFEFLPPTRKNKRKTNAFTIFVCGEAFNT